MQELDFDVFVSPSDCIYLVISTDNITSGQKIKEDITWTEQIKWLLKGWNTAQEKYMKNVYRNAIYRECK